jgi:erythromycin esterase-like protein
MARVFDNLLIFEAGILFRQYAGRHKMLHPLGLRPAWLWHSYLLAIVLVSLVLCEGVSSAQSPVQTDAWTGQYKDEEAPLNAILDELCDRQIVMLGENGFHGEGKTIALKAQLVEQLVTRCGFRIVLFEASQYEFLDIERKARRGDAISREQISAAIGQIWNQNREMDGLISLLARAKGSGDFIVGGLDDQLGSRGLLFGNDPMIAELTGLLPPDLRQACAERLLRRTYSAYSKKTPYTSEERDGLRECVGAIRKVLLARLRTGEDPFLLAMLDNLDRYLARDFQSDPQRIAGRAASMHLNLRWWLSKRGNVEPKVIVWAANSHIAKGSGIDAAYNGGAPLGNLIAAEFGKRSYALGFSSNSGTYRWSRTETKAIPTNSGSLENRAIGTTGKAVAFLSGRSLGKKPELAGLLNHQFYQAKWREFFDGVVVFQSERPPTRFTK